MTSGTETRPVPPTQKRNLPQVVNGSRKTLLARNGTNGKNGTNGSHGTNGHAHKNGALLPLLQPAQPKLRVCVLAACPFPANHGSPGAIRELSEAIVQLGHDVHIVTYHIGENIPVIGPLIHRIPDLTRESEVVVGPTSRRPLYDLQLVFKTLEVIRQHRPHLLHAHGYEAAVAAWICRLITGLPVLFSSHSTMGDELASYGVIRPMWFAKALARFLDAFVPRTADRCLPHCTALEGFFHRLGLRKRTEPIVGFGIDLDSPVTADPIALRQRHGLGDGPVIVYAGVMDVFQRLDLLLGGMAQVVKAAPTAKLLVIQTIHHEKHLQTMRRQIQELGIGSNVVITEPQSLSSVRELLTVADVAVVPRPKATGCPIKLINYMAAKKPCAVFASSTSKGLSHLDNVYLVPSDTTTAMGDAILTLLHDPVLRKKLARNGFKFVREYHDRRAIAQQVCRAYYDTLAGVGRSPFKHSKRPGVNGVANGKSNGHVPLPVREEIPYAAAQAVPVLCQS